MARILSRGPIFEIREDGDFAVCELKSAQSITKEEGARCAEMMRETIVGQVVVPNSPYRGLLFDVRLGPAAFGPKTREELAQIFTRANGLNFKVGVLVSTSPTQHLQFSNLAQECAAQSALVSKDVAPLSVFLQTSYIPPH
jgi:hypothetical protein